MPKGPRGEKRPADVIGAAVQIATGEIEEDLGTTDDGKDKAAVALGRMVGGRDASYATDFIADLKGRLSNRVQITTDGHKAYLEAIEGAFGSDVDYAMLVSTTAKARPARSASTALQSASALARIS